MLGRALAPGEVVHHQGGNRRNNAPENLRVLPSQRHHMALEQLQRRVERGVEPLFSAEELLKRIVRNKDFFLFIFLVGQNGGWCWWWTASGFSRLEAR